MVEMLPDLLITGFRAFKHLEIEKLARVNLITGKNNSGKSSVLEALHLYAGGASVIDELLQSRDESATSDAADGLAALNLFHGRITVDDIERRPRIEIGPATNRLVLEPGWYDLNLKQFLDTRAGVPALKITFADWNDVITLHRPLKDSFLNQPLNHPTAEYVGPEGLAESKIGHMWDIVDLTDLEDEVVRCLQLIAPEVDRVSIRAGAPIDQRVPFVRVRGGSRPIPLRSLGDGMNRLFGIALAMVNAQDGLLLVDEIENGVHYSVQPKLWAFIVQLARRLNVQVFATTHSWDCITAFQQAAREHDSEGMLIRLDWRNGFVRAVEFTEDELAIATRESIEVR